MAKSQWSVNSNGSRLKKFMEIIKNRDQIFKYMFIDSGKITSTSDKEPLEM